MKPNKLTLALAIGMILAVLVIGVNFGNRHAGDVAVGLSFVGYTNVNGNSMGLFKVQNNQSRRIWLRNGNYLLGEAFQQPPGAWQCPDLAASNRWSVTPMIPHEYLPPEPTRTSSDPTNLTIPAPTNQNVWRIGLTVEFNIWLSERVRAAWRSRDLWMLNPRQFINNSPEAIWVESPVITNALGVNGISRRR